MALVPLILFIIDSCLVVQHWNIKLDLIGSQPLVFTILLSGDFKAVLFLTP